MRRRPTPAFGSYVVNSLDDAVLPDLGVECITPEAPCTLRAAVQHVMAAPTPGATIAFSVSGTIDLVATLEVRASMAIDGAGQHVTLRNPAGDSTIFAGAAPAAARAAAKAAAKGGRAAVKAEARHRRTASCSATSRSWGPRPATHPRSSISGGTATVENMAFSGNLYPGDLGSAIINAGNLTVVNSTFIDNAGVAPGGTIMSFGTLTVNNSTFFENDGGSIGSGFGATATITNSLFKGDQGGFNCPFDATFVSGNLSDDDSCYPEPGGAVDSDLYDLGAFGGNGGWVSTIPIGPDSIAIGAADVSSCPATDARGQSRPLPPHPATSAPTRRPPARRSRWTPT